MRITLKAQEIRNAIERRGLTQEARVLHMHGEMLIEFTTKDVFYQIMEEMLKGVVPPEEV